VVEFYEFIARRMAFNSYRPQELFSAFCIPWISLFIVYIIRSLVERSFTNSTWVVTMYVFVVYWAMYSIVISVLIMAISNRGFMTWLRILAFLGWTFLCWFLLFDAAL